MKFVDKIPGVLARVPVGGHATPYLILYHQHPQLFELLAQFLDVIANQPVIDVHVRPVVEQVQGAGYIDFQRRGDMVGFLFLHVQQGVIQVA